MTLGVDASVAVKWYFDEPDTDKARLVLDSGHLLVAPSLIVVEVANVAWKKQRRGEANPGQVRSLADELPDSFLLIPEERLVGRALAIAEEIDHPVYDCLYLAASERWNAPLITHDKRLLEKIKNTVWARIVVALSEYETRQH